MPLLKKLHKKRVKKRLVVQMTEQEYEQIVENAKKYTAGNITQWFIYTAIHYTPKKDEVK